MPKTALSDVLMRMSYELHTLADATEEFHHLAFAEDGTPALQNMEFVRATQSIDLTQQILANLSDFVACLAMASPATMVQNTHGLATRAGYGTGDRPAARRPSRPGERRLRLA